jgi:hypothetical protein
MVELVNYRRGGRAKRPLRGFSFPTYSVKVEEDAQRGLVDGSHHQQVATPGKACQERGNLYRASGVEARRGFVQKENVGIADQLKACKLTTLRVKREAWQAGRRGRE